jgi:hypothetical protein
MASGQMQVYGSIAELGVSKQYLNGAQIGASFQHMCGKAVTKHVRINTLRDPEDTVAAVY